MTKGVVLIAFNNQKIDYIKQSVYCARQIKKFLKLPVSLITDDIQYAKQVSNNCFDKIILDDAVYPKYSRTYFDGSIDKNLEFRNIARIFIYEKAPYEETIVMDTDFLVGNDKLLKCFESTHDFLIYKDATDLAPKLPTNEFEYINDVGIPFYWATCFFFRKGTYAKTFFDLLIHIAENWPHYKELYHINQTMLRNDFIFSIAIHILTKQGMYNFKQTMPDKMYYITDTDYLLKHWYGDYTCLCEKQKNSNDYIVVKANSINLHAMNKFSLERVIEDFNV